MTRLDKALSMVKYDANTIIRDKCPSEFELDVHCDSKSVIENPFDNNRIIGCRGISCKTCWNKELECDDVNKYITMFMNDNNLSRNEKFNIVKTSNDLIDTIVGNPFSFDGNLVYDNRNNARTPMLGGLISGIYSIEKLPFIPEVHDVYYRLEASSSCGYIRGQVTGEVTLINLLVSRKVIFYRTYDEIMKEIKRLEW